MMNFLGAAWTVTAAMLLFAHLKGVDLGLDDDNGLWIAVASTVALLCIRTARP